MGFRNDRLYNYWTNIYETSHWSLWYLYKSQEWWVEYISVCFHLRFFFSSFLDDLELPDGSLSTSVTNFGNEWRTDSGVSDWSFICFSFPSSDYLYLVHSQCSTNRSLYYSSITWSGWSSLSTHTWSIWFIQTLQSYLERFSNLQHMSSWSLCSSEIWCQSSRSRCLLSFWSDGTWLWRELYSCELAKIWSMSESLFKRSNLYGMCNSMSSSMSKLSTKFYQFCGLLQRLCTRLCLSIGNSDWSWSKCYMYTYGSMYLLLPW